MIIVNIEIINDHMAMKRKGSSTLKNGSEAYLLVKKSIVEERRPVIIPVRAPTAVVLHHKMPSRMRARLGPWKNETTV